MRVPVARNRPPGRGVRGTLQHHRERCVVTFRVSPARPNPVKHSITLSNMASRTSTPTTVAMADAALSSRTMGLLR